jgi:hypothetical protein
MNLVLICLLLVCNGYMTGLIWFVQLVHYPMMARFDRQLFLQIQLEHQTRTSRAVLLPMLGSLLASVVIVFVRPESLSWAWIICNSVLTLVWCCSTAFWQIPLHDRLAKNGYDKATHLQLVHGNWLRTVAWTLQFALNLGMLFQLGF